MAWQSGVRRSSRKNNKTQAKRESGFYSLDSVCIGGLCANDVGFAEAIEATSNTGEFETNSENDGILGIGLSTFFAKKLTVDCVNNA